MTELEVLYKLERAYSRKWWQFWRKKYPIDIDERVSVVNLMQFCNSDYDLFYKVKFLLDCNCHCGKLRKFFFYIKDGDEYTLEASKKDYLKVIRYTISEIK